MKQLLGELKDMMDQLNLGDEEISRWVKKAKTIRSVHRLPGDASARKYYRVISDSGNYIVMKMDPFGSPRGGEGGSGGRSKSTPFLDVQKHLELSKVDVPKLFDADGKLGFILLEDLGDVTFLKRLQTVKTEKEERLLYERVVDSLVDLQVKASQPNKKLPLMEAFDLSFDFEKLMWEVNFTLDNFYKVFLKRKIKAVDLKKIIDGFSNICEYLASQPRVFTHRDFHSRNIMAVDSRLVMIDFQDARMGPRQYDLASLLRDSYYQLEDSQVVHLVDYYLRRYKITSGLQLPKGEFMRGFDFMAIQRNFKAIGSFASFMNTRGDPNYLKYIGNTFENIRKTLFRYEEFSALKEILFNYYYF